MTRSPFDWWSWRRPAPAEPGYRKSRWRHDELFLLEERLLLSINVVIDYSNDTNHFFDTQQKRDLAQQAASVVALGLSGDHLNAISPSATNLWTASFPDPATGAARAIDDLSVPADTIIIYVGGRALTNAGEAGIGSTGGYHASGDQAWLDNLQSRGHAGALAPTPTSYGPWGGSITFDMDSTRWYFGTSNNGLNSTMTDFFTVAEHEIGHVLGIGTSPSWFGHVSGDSFTGANAEAVFGGPVPLGPDHAHWADKTQSNAVNAVMDPVLYNGSRSMFTDLDYAGLADVGWVVRPPVQSSTVQFASAGFSVTASGQAASIIVIRNGGVGPLTINYTTGDISAQAGVDYLPTAGTLTFGIGETSKTFTVPILDAAKTRGGGTILVGLSNPSAGSVLGAQSTALLSIIDNKLIPAADFNGDGRTDIGVFRPATAQWLVQPSGGAPWDNPAYGSTNLTDIPVPADYERAGHSEIAVFRPGTAQWIIEGYAQPFTFGAPNLTDIPVPADYLGLGYAQPGVFRPSTGQWFIAGQAQPFSFGATNLTDIPVPGDYDGVGHAELAVFRPSTGEWFIAGHTQPIFFGATNLTDIPVPGDYDGVGHAELAVFRPSTGEWFIAGHQQPISFGAANLLDLPLEAPIGSLVKLGLVGNQSLAIHSTAQDPISAAIVTSSSGSIVISVPIAPDSMSAIHPAASRHKKPHRAKHGRIG